MRAKIIAVWGYKGKTTMAVNLAWSLVLYKKDVLVTLLSTNLAFGDIQGFFGQAIHEQKGLQQALLGESHARSLLWKAATEGIAKDIYLMTLPNEVDSLYVETPTLDQAEKLIEELSSGDHTDYLIVDCSADLHNPLAGAALANADTIFCLHQPGWAAYQWYRGMRSVCEQLYLSERTKHIIYAQDQSCEVGSYVKELGLEITEELPFVASARQYESKGLPICAEESRHTARYRQTMKGLCALL